MDRAPTLRLPPRRGGTESRYDIAIDPARHGARRERPGNRPPIGVAALAVAEAAGACIALLLLGCLLAGAGCGAGGGGGQAPGSDGSSVAEPDGFAASTCDDGLRNQDESDIDCGGTACAGCAEGKGCGGDGDCAAGLCVAGTCSAQSCDDARHDGQETDVDCGGPDCGRCLLDQRCEFNADCASRHCKDQVCSKAVALTLAFGPELDFDLLELGVTDIALADFTGDGNLDVAVSSLSAEVQLLAGKGNGDFSNLGSFEGFGVTIDFIAALDFDSDQHADLVTVSKISKHVSVLYGQNAGLSAPTVVALLDAQPVDGVAAGDFDGDGRGDIAVSPQSMLFGSWKREFQIPVRTNVAFPTNLPLRAFDFNRDGRTDLLASPQLLRITVDRSLAVAWTNADDLKRPSSLALGDLDGDGRQDLVYAGDGKQLAIYLGAAKGGFGAPTILALDAAPYSVGVADFNQDGWDDVAAYGNPGQVRVFLGNGAGKLSPRPAIFPVGSDGDLTLKGSALLARDVNKDGKLDALLLFASPPRVTVLLNASK